MAIRREALKEGYQPPLFVVPPLIDKVTQQSIEESHRRKIGLLTRLLQGIPNGTVLRHIRETEANFKAGGTRTRFYLYDTRSGQQQVEATPEDLHEILGHRRVRAGLRQK